MGSNQNLDVATPDGDEPCIGWLAFVQSVGNVYSQYRTEISKAVGRTSPESDSPDTSFGEHEANSAPPTSTRPLYANEEQWLEIIPRLKRYLLAKGLNEHEADEVTQETIVKLLQLHRENGNWSFVHTSLSGMAIVVASRMRCDFLRRIVRGRECNARLATEFGECEFTVESLHEMKFETDAFKERAKLLVEVWRQLDRMERDLLVLLAYKLTEISVAELLMCEPNQVRNSKLALRRKLERLGVTAPWANTRKPRQSKQQADHPFYLGAEDARDDATDGEAHNPPSD